MSAVSQQVAFETLNSGGAATHFSLSSGSLGHRFSGTSQNPSISVKQTQPTPV
jgi:hypothetical protein